ncbi:MAG: LPXTG cell wall anchor domain-containing protein [Nanoarchaeota archaeon]|nr:LPXTG cell wall anchor domain-containing protein [Nanoarchaeota archaeon]
MKSLIIFVLITLMLITSVSAECVDTDDGKNFGVKGVTTYTKDGRVISEVVDSCLDETRLEEYFCEPDGKSTATRYDCLEGCEDGICIEEKPIEEVVEEPEVVISEEPEEEIIIAEPEVEPTQTNNIWVSIVILALIIAAVIFWKKKKKPKKDKEEKKK